jgi:hypothetical protein
MQGTRQFLELMNEHNLVSGHLRGIFHIAIGRRILNSTGVLIAEGVTWRTLAALLKDLKFDREFVRELGAEPETLSPKDREKFWYNAIMVSKVDGPEARKQAEAISKLVKSLGLVIGPAPGHLEANTLESNFPPSSDELLETPSAATGKKKKKP